MTPAEEEWVAAVRTKAERMAAARRERRSLLEVLGHTAGLGWALALPLLLGVLLGRLLAGAAGRPSLTLVGVGVGLLAGGWLAWRQVRRALLHAPREGAS